MSLTTAERTRRSRAHKAGNHDLCDPKRCKPQPVTIPRESRGDRLLREVRVGLRPAQVILLEEAARIVDRLDRLDDILTGDRQEWLRLRLEDSGDITVIVNGPLAEARQQAATLKAIISELRQSAGPIALPRNSEGESVGISGLTDEVARKRATKN